VSARNSRDVARNKQHDDVAQSEQPDVASRRHPGQVEHHRCRTASEPAEHVDDHLRRRRPRTPMIGAQHTRTLPGRQQRDHVVGRDLAARGAEVRPPEPAVVLDPEQDVEPPATQVEVYQRRRPRPRTLRRERSRQA
jgi:hypothetical protein